MILVWDTCALNVVCRAIADHIRYTSEPDIAPGLRGPDFLVMLQNIMNELQVKCEYTSHTAEIVFSIEVDPTAAGSQLRNQHPLLDHFCDQGAFIAEWQAVLENTISPETVHDEEVEVMRQSIRPDPGQCDISLIVAALKLSAQAGENCVIVTDDTPLSNRINELKRSRREVFLNGQQHSTERVTAKLSLQVLHELYLSCGVDHDFWRSAMYSYDFHYNIHEGQAGNRYHQNVVTFLSRIPGDRREKELRRVAADLGGIFGAEDA
jgi:hypothetical protein